MQYFPFYSFQTFLLKRRGVVSNFKKRNLFFLFKWRLLQFKIIYYADLSTTMERKDAEQNLQSTAGKNTPFLPSKFPLTQI